MAPDTRRVNTVRLHASLILVSIAVLSTVLTSVSGAGMVMGLVTGNDMNGQRIPLSWANITVYANGVRIVSLSPAFDGSYSMSLPAGLYVVTVEHHGFNGQNKRVEVYNGRSTRLDFYLDSISASVSNAFDFGLSSGGPITIRAGDSGWTIVQVTLRSGPSQIVNLTVSGIPSGAFVSLNASSGRPSFISICTILTSPAAPVGSYLVTLFGVAGGMTHSTSFTLTIVQRAFLPDML
jgi:hypothetical protein